MIFGVLFTVLASMSFDLSNLLEKRAVDRMDEISARRAGHMIGRLYTSRLWMTGFVVGMVAVGFIVVAYSLAPVAVVQTIFGAGVVFLVVASRFYLGEQIARREKFGLGVVVIAVILVSVTLGASTSLGVTGSPLRVFTVSVVTMGIAGLIFGLMRSSSIDSGISFGVTSGLFYGVAQLQAKSAAALVAHHGVLAGLPRVFESPYPYVFAVTSILGLFTFQTGLQRCRIAVVSPITNIIAGVYIVAIGTTVFNEALPRNMLLAVMRFVGFALVLIGTWVLATGTPTTSQLVGRPIIKSKLAHRKEVDQGGAKGPHWADVPKD